MDASGKRDHERNLLGLFRAEPAEIQTPTPSVPHWENACGWSRTRDRWSGRATDVRDGSASFGSERRGVSGGGEERMMLMPHARSPLVASMSTALTGAAIGRVAGFWECGSISSMTPSTGNRRAVGWFLRGPGRVTFISALLTHRNNESMDRHGAAESESRELSRGPFARRARDCESRTSRSPGGWIESERSGLGFKYPRTIRTEETRPRGAANRCLENGRSPAQQNYLAEQETGAGKRG